MERSRRIAAALALAAVLAALLAPTTAGAFESAFLQIGPESAVERLASESTLRLADLPPGYVLSENPVCGEPRHPSENFGIMEEEEHLPPTPSEAFIAAQHPGFCFIEYHRLYRAAGTGATPASLASFALVAPNPKAAAEGLALGSEPYEYTLDTGGFTAAGPAPAIGEETRLFHTNRGYAGRLTNLPSTLLLWRQGATIGGVFATSMKSAVSDAAATAYATRQATYIAAPRPYPYAEADDRSVYLHNPNIKVPIYWLGAAFEPKGLPAAYFEAALGAAEQRSQIPGRELTLRYSNFRILSTFTPSGWAKFSRTARGNPQPSQHCTRSQLIKLPHGHATIYAFYTKEYATCPTFPPHHFSADVFLPGAVITFGDGDLYGYESWRGLKTIARGLRRYQG
jgi:hypothetical protein